MADGVCNPIRNVHAKGEMTITHGMTDAGCKPCPARRKIMDTQERIGVAEEKIKRISQLIINLLQVRANNEIALFSDHLAKQVGESYAANAFNSLTTAMFEIEVARICALWDGTRGEREARDRDSLTAVAWLISPEEVVDALVERIRANRKEKGFELINPPEDLALRAEAEEICRQNHNAKGDEEAVRVRKRAQETLSWVEKIGASDLHKGLRNHRDKHIAHALVQTNPERKGTVPAPMYGETGKLFKQTIEVFDGFFYVICDSRIAWKYTHEQTTRCAEALWRDCAFNVVE